MKNLQKQAIGIVAQLFDLAEVPVDKRQQINDVAYDYVTEQLIITDVGSSSCKKTEIIEVLNNRRKQAFDNQFHKYENNEMKQAIDIINRLLPDD